MSVETVESLTYFSQYGQDRFLHEKIFKGKRDGYFVELGAHDGVTLSNTLTFERYFGWKGICIEAHDGLYESLKANRTCHCVQACIWTGEKADFVETEGELGWHSALGGIAQRISESGIPENCRRILVNKQTVTLASVLDQCAAPSVIDFLSLDTEGSEYDILKDFPFDRYRFGAIVIEHNCDRLQVRRQRQLLKQNGYWRIYSDKADDYWIDPSLPCARRLLHQRRLRDLILAVPRAVHSVRAKSARLRRISAQPGGLVHWSTRKLVDSKFVGTLKSPLKRLLAKMGFTLHRIQAEPNSADPFLIQKRIVGNANVIMDCGAHYGQTALKYAELFANSKIYSFEPFPESFRQLEQRTTGCPQVVCQPLGVAEFCGTRAFYSNTMSGTNSLFDFKDSFETYWPGFAGQRERVTVEVTTLDDFCRGKQIEQIDILKLDLQGGEVLALTGAERLLSEKRVRLVFCEVMFVTYYEEAPLLWDVVSHLESRGYYLFDLFVTAHSSEGQVLQGDAIFLPRGEPKQV